MKTILQIQEGLRAAGKPVKVAQLYRYLKRFNIRAVAKLRPAIYPDNTVETITRKLGLKGGR